MPLLVLGSLACTPQKSPPPPSATPETAFSEPTPYAGSAACKPCHPAEFQSHQKTFHAATLREATLADLGPLAPTPGTVPGGSFAIDQGRLVSKSWTGELPLSFALGSGKTGLTFLAVAYDSSTEIRQSYFPHAKTWLTTPGQDSSSSEFGQVHTEEFTRKCLGCHTVTMPKASLLPEKRFFGVGCESCHGPGEAHITAMQQSPLPKVKAITSLRGATGTQLNALCGKCHRTGADLVGMSADAKQMTNRFQPYGLALSRCFKQSDNKLTCITCHNPHQDASKDHKAYEEACLSCHATGIKGKICPVNPKEKCVACHMTTRPVFKNSPLPIQMADHFIRLYKK